MTLALQTLRERFSRLTSDDLMLIADASDLRELLAALARRKSKEVERRRRSLVAMVHPRWKRGRSIV